jgi:hypothetical protein
LTLFEYAIVFWLETVPNQTIRVPDLPVTSIENVKPDSIARLLGINHRPDPMWIVWRVEAFDRANVALPAANAPFRIQVPALSVNEDNRNVIPDHFSFPATSRTRLTPETKVKYGVPRAANVSITVWDMHGRQIASLQQGRMAPGQYEAVWIANGLTSGVYFIRMQSEGFVTMNKAILVR